MKKFLKIFGIIVIIVPILLIVGFKGYLDINKQIQYHENKEVVYDYLQEKFGKEFKLIKVEKENFDFWTSRQDYFYFKDIEEDFVFTVTAAHGNVDYDSYSESKFGKEVEKEFYKDLPRDTTSDFIFTAAAYDSERDDTHCIKGIESTLYIFDEDVDYKEAHKLVQYIFNKFSDEWDVAISLQVYSKEAKEDIEKLVRCEMDYDDIDSGRIFGCWVRENRYDINDLEEFIEYVNVNNFCS